MFFKKKKKKKEQRFLDISVDRITVCFIFSSGLTHMWRSASVLTAAGRRTCDFYVCDEGTRQPGHQDIMLAVNVSANHRYDPG